MNVFNCGMPFSHNFSEFFSKLLTSEKKYFLLENKVKSKSKLTESLLGETP